jgi:RNA polymerase sigma factor (sigma-70 family)
MIGLERLKLEESDHVLVRRFARDHDGEAFSVLMGRYADMVYTTCRRILGNEALAADAVQETFFQLVKNSHRITGSLGGWLHRVATRRAVDIIRQDASRRHREEAYTLDGVCEASTWSEVVPAVDEALEKLPEELREILLLHFLQGRTTIQIAAAQGVSQPTISRRLNEALELLRQTLRDQGIHASLVPLQTVLLHSNHAAPEALRSGLGKIALAKAVAANSGWLTAASAPATGVAIKLALAAAALVLTVATTRIARYERQKRQSAKAAATAPLQGQLNAAAAGNFASAIGGGPAPQIAAPAPQPANPARVAANAVLRTMPPRVAPRNPATNQAPANPGVELSAAAGGPAGPVEPVLDQAVASPWPATTYPVTFWGGAAPYGGFYNRNFFARGDIIKPDAGGISPAWANYNINPAMTLSPGPIRNYAPARYPAAAQSKAEPGRR